MTQFAEQTSFYLWLSIPGMLVTIADIWVIVACFGFILLNSLISFCQNYMGKYYRMWRVILIVLLFIPFTLPILPWLIFVDVSI